MTWLVTGGAGYIGAHVVRSLAEAGLEPVVYDNLSTGFREFVPENVPFVWGDIGDLVGLTAAMREHRVTGVIHVAGYKFAGVSVQRPLHTYTQNVTATVTVLQAMADAGVTKIVFSSSAAVYGTPDVDIVTEQTATAPESPYGESKLIGEWLLSDQARVTDLQHVSLRYFNVVGSGSRDLYDASPHNLFPMVISALRSGGTPRINGVDYPTPDGTCVRDYVHVADLAHSHAVAAAKLDAGEKLLPVYNLGSGDGSSVREIMTAMATVSGTPDEPVIAPARAGDPARIVADGLAAARDLEWAMRHSLTDMVTSAWEAAPTPRAVTATQR